MAQLNEDRPSSSGRLTQVPASLEVRQADALRELSRRMRRPQQALIREAIEHLLQKYRKELTE